MRQTTAAAIALVLSAPVAACDQFMPDQGKNLITANLQGASVQLTAFNAFYQPAGYDCFDDGNRRTDLTLVTKDSDGQEHTQALSYTLDQPTLIRTLVPLDSRNASMQFRGQTMTCFDASVRQYKRRFSGFQIPLGTLHIQSVSFINDFNSAGLFGGSVEVRSYKAAFTIDQEHSTGQGALPAFELTCIVAKDPVQNQWTYQGCK